MDATGLWDELETDWLALDAELLPWSLKAEELLRTQYASVGAAATAAGRAAVKVLDQAAARGIEMDGLVGTQRERLAMAEAFVDAYRPYCWSVSSLADVKVAPFQLLASEGNTYVDREHVWHMGIADRLAAVAPTLVRATKHRSWT